MGEHLIRIQLPLPATVIGGLLGAIDERWPGATMAVDDPRSDHMAVRITDDGERPEGEQLEVLAAAGGGFELGGAEQTVHAIAEMLAALLDKHDAPNHVEMGLQAADGSRYSVIVVRPDGKTPFEMRVEAEATADAATRLARMLWEGASIYQSTSYRRVAEGEKVWVWTERGSQDTGRPLDAELVALVETFGPR